MALSFFDIVDNGTVSRDEFGVDLPGFDEARDQAVVLLPGIARDELLDGEQHTSACWVRDERDRVIDRGTLTCQGERPTLDGRTPPPFVGAGGQNSRQILPKWAPLS